VRAVVLDGDALLEMHLETAFDGPAAGAVVEARCRGPAEALADGATLALDRPAPVAEGGRFLAEIVRMSIPEAGRRKPARARPVDGPLRPAPSLSERLAAAGHPARPAWPEQAAEGWDMGWQRALLGCWPVAGGVLRLQPTPAFLAVDIDGAVAPEPTAVALAAAIRAWGLGGNIVADFPTRPGRDWRQAAAAAFDAAMAGLPFERTAINGYGLLQVVRPRVRPSILEHALLLRDETEACALLDQAVAEPRPGRVRIVARPAVARLLEGRPDLLAAVARLAGRAVDVVADPAAGAGHVAAG
jgi:hypothetical protein